MREHATTCAKPQSPGLKAFQAGGARSTQENHTEPEKKPTASETERKPSYTPPQYRSMQFHQIQTRARQRTSSGKNSIAPQIKQQCKQQNSKTSLSLLLPRRQHENGREEHPARKRQEPHARSRALPSSGMSSGAPHSLANNARDRVLLDHLDHRYSGRHFTLLSTVVS